MIRLSKTLQAWGTPAFEDAFKAELEGIDPALLPLQAGLSQSSCVAVGGIQAMLLGASETADRLRVRAGVFYAGIVMGSCCADDPTPVDEQAEYCELQFDIDRRTAETSVVLADQSGSSR